MARNTRVVTEGATIAPIASEPLLQTILPEPCPEMPPVKPMPSLSAVFTCHPSKMRRPTFVSNAGAVGLSAMRDHAPTLAEAERWLAVIPPTAECYRLLQLGVLRRDVSLLEGLLSVLRNR